MCKPFCVLALRALAGPHSFLSVYITSIFILQVLHSGLFPGWDMLLKISHKDNYFHLLASINLVFIHVALLGFAAQQGEQRESIANTGRPHHEQQGCRQQVKGGGHSPLLGICESSFGYQQTGKVSAKSHCDSQGQLHLPCEERLSSAWRRVGFGGPAGRS